MNKINHEFWGKVDEDDIWTGFSPENKYYIPYFNLEATILLDDEFDDDGEEKGYPTIRELDDYAKTYDVFMQSLNKLILDIKQQAYDRYKKYYASYYESENPPLEIEDHETHFNYMKNLNYIRISNNNIIRICIRYDLDTEHGMEIKIQSNKVVQIGGLSETY